MNHKEFSFFKFPKSIDKEINELKSKSAEFWLKKGESMAKLLFSHVYRNTKAYRDFLRDNKADKLQIKSMADFRKLPVATKENYLRKYRYTDLFLKNEFFKPKTYTATSGSTGEPFFFPRGVQQDAQYEYVAELFLKNQFQIDKKTTLGMMGFALGIWIGGVFTYKNFNKISEKGYSFSLMPVGTDKEKFLNCLKKFGHLYDQIILMGYPPFIKDVLDSGPDYGIKWKDYAIKILTAAEGYSEDFRMYIAKKAGIKNPISDIINIYGTVELGTMAHETALANLIRHLALKNKKLFKILFPKATNIPTLAQFHPDIVWFEENHGELLASGFGSSIPLLRYQFNDLGGVIYFEEMLEKLKSCNVDIFKEMKDRGIKNDIFKLPFVYLYARSDLAVVFRGANIYPGEISNALDKQILSRFITGRFTMIRKEDKQMDQCLELNIELKKGVKRSNKIIHLIVDEFINDLRESNSEYSYLYNMEGREKLSPRVILWPYQHPQYFKSIGKQKWI